MELAQEVVNFTSACEHLLAAVAHRSMTDDEARIVKYYCNEILEKGLPPKHRVGG
jgi:hypothetical protein